MEKHDPEDPLAPSGTDEARGGRRLALALGVLGLATLVLLLVQGLFDPSRLHVQGRYIDQAGYITTARTLLDTGELKSGLVYPSQVENPRWRPYMPGHYVTLALSYLVLGYGVFASLLPNLIAHLILSTCAFLIGNRIYGWRVGLVAGLLVACFPPALLYAFTAMAEPTFTAAGLLAFTVWLHLPPARRPWLAPVLLALPFLYRETGSLYVLPMVVGVLAVSSPRRLLQGIGVFAAAVLVLGLINQWQLATGKGAVPLTWVSEQKFNYTNAFPPDSPELAPAEWASSILANARRNFAVLRQQVRTDATDMRVVGFVLILVLTIWHVIAGARRWRRDALPLGAGLMGLAIVLLIFGLYDVKGEKALRSSLFTYPLLLVCLTGSLARTRLGPWMRNGERWKGAVLALAVVAAGWMFARPLGAALTEDDEAYELATKNIAALQPDPERVLMAHFHLAITFAVEGYPVRWSFMPENDATLRYMDRQLDLGMLIIPQKMVGERLSQQVLQELGFQRRRVAVKSHSYTYVVFAKP